MRCFIIGSMVAVATFSQAQQVSGDFDGDGRKEYAKSITIIEPYHQGGYLPVSMPGEYKISFSGSKIPDIYCAHVSYKPLIITDCNANKMDELLLIGSDNENLVTGFTATLYEWDGMVMQPFISGRLVSTLQVSHEEEKTVFTRNDSAWFIDDVSPWDSLVSSQIRARLIYPVREKRSTIIRPGHVLYTAYKPYINVPADTAVYAIDTVPRFKDYGTQTLKQYVNLNTKYPVEALEAGKEGTVYVTIEINTLGKVSGVKITNKVHPALMHEARRVYQSLPDFEPVIKNGKPVRVRIKDNIVFRLK